MSQLSLVDSIVCLAYLGILIGLAIGSMRGQQDNEDYFVGGRRMNWIAVGISMFATSFSSISFLGLPQRGAYQDFSFYLVLLGIPLIITPIICLLFVPLYARLKVSSGYQYLGLRFGPIVQRLGSLLYCGYALGWMGAMLYAITLTLQSVLHLNSTQYLWALIGLGTVATAYTVAGGLKAVIWTDVLQAITLGGAVIVILALAVAQIDGGWSGLWAIGQQHERFILVPSEPGVFSLASLSKENSLAGALAYVVFMYLPGYAVAQNMIQRYVCAGNMRRGQGVVILSALVNVTLGFLFLLVGVALFAFYVQPGGSGLPSLASEDQILPHFVATQAAGIGLVGLMLAGLFAAAMSTIDSGINGVASVVVYDWLGGKQMSIGFSRALTAALGILVIISALLVPLLGNNVIGIINTIAGTLLGGLLAVFLLGMFASRANQAGVLCGLVFGAACLFLVITVTDVPKWWYGAFTLFPTLIVGALASYAFPAPSREARQGLVQATENPSS